MNYWTRENKDASAEVDFVWQHQNKITPIEVKSGKAAKLRSPSGEKDGDRLPDQFTDQYTSVNMY